MEERKIEKSKRIAPEEEAARGDEGGRDEDGRDEDGRDEDGRDEDGREDICLKSYQQGKEILVAACDSDILGKEFREGNLHIEVHSDFFGDEKTTLSELEAALRGATMANFVGRKAVELAIRLGYVDEKNVLCIDGVLYAQMVRM